MGFDLMDLMNKATKEESQKESLKVLETAGLEVKTASVYELVPNKENYYSMRDIDELASAIEAAGGIKEPVVVSLQDDGALLLVSGHRRRAATLQLVSQGKKEFEQVPYIVERGIAGTQDELDLITLLNSQREKTDYDKVKEAAALKEIMRRKKKEEKLPGRVREMVAEKMKIKPSQVGRYERIDKYLTEEWKKELEEENIDITTASELSTLSGEKQWEIYQEYQMGEPVSAKRIKELQETEKNVSIMDTKEPEKETALDHTNELEVKQEAEPETKKAPEPTKSEDESEPRQLAVTENSEIITESNNPVKTEQTVLEQLIMAASINGAVFCRVICDQCGGNDFCGEKDNCYNKSRTERGRICMEALSKSQKGI